MLTLAGCAGDEQSEAPTVPTAESAAPAPAPAAESVTPEPEPAPVGEEDVPANAEEEADPVDVADATDAAYDEVVANFRAAETVGTFFDGSYGYAVFPTIGKGGFVIGGAYGKGRTYVDGEVTGTTSVTQASIGLQAGGQAFSQIVFFENQAEYKNGMATFTYAKGGLMAGAAIGGQKFKFEPAG
jgi:lipid-binding SYLF domain-containing protein